MLSLGALGFAAPLALAALASLPVLYLLLRATPPAPRRTPFPPMRLLMDAEQDEETPRRTPLWLVILRLLIAALVILGLARPILFPRDEGPSRPLLLVVDDGWSAAANWERLQEEGLAQIDVAARTGQPVALVFTAPRLEAEDIVSQEPAQARQRLEAHAPAAWPADRAVAAERLRAAEIGDGYEAIFLSSGVGGEGARDLLQAAQARGNLGQARALTPPALNAPLAMRPPLPNARGFEAQIVRADGSGARDGELAALSADGRLVARADFSFADGETVATASASLPPELRRRAALVRVTSSPSAGAAAAIGDAWRRPAVGIVEEGAADAQPLLSDLYYLEKALEPFADVRNGSLAEFLEQPPGVIALVDGAGGPRQSALEDYVEEGGVLLRFAGPLLSAGRDDLLPVLLREGGRDFGGALAWGEPQHLSEFSEDSPFAGLAVSQEVEVQRQVLAEPEADLSQKTWARLEDGTPLVTAERQGRGWVVLFHVTAGPEWSTLPLSGLYPEMLERVTAYAEGGAGPATETGGAWAPDRVLTAEGLLADPPPEARPIPAAEWETAALGPRTPPGLYRRGAALEGLNVADEEFTMEALPSLAGVATDVYGERSPRPMAGPLLLLALLLLAADAIVALILSGRGRMLARRLTPGRAASGAAAALALAAALGLALGPQPAHAQDGASDGEEAGTPMPQPDIVPPEGVFDVRFGYVRTGDRQIDDMSFAGLVGLSFQLQQRTAVEPRNPVALDLENDTLIFYPLIYWPLTQNAQPLSDAAIENLNNYVAAGGTVLIDTRDAGTRISEGQASEALRTALAGLDIPPLQPTPQDHVLTKSFFLLESFPGRWRDGRLWVEAEAASGARDGVSGYIVGGNDWAAAWAVDDQGRPLAALPGAAPQQREMAYRFGINLVMYVLTGNYKSDQVHIPALLQRLGREGEE